MRTLPRIAISALIGLSACSQVPPGQPGIDNAAQSGETIYHIGDSAFAFRSGEVLQTWPVIAYRFLALFSDVLAPPCSYSRPVMLDLDRSSG